MTKVTVLGTTTWGTTLGILLSRSNINTTLLAQTEETAHDLDHLRENARFLPGISFPPTLRVTHNLEEALQNSTMIIIAVPSQSFRSNARRISNISGNLPIVMSGTKGLEMRTGKRMTQILKEEFADTLNPPICVLSGPTLAMEMLEGKPASAVVASSTTEAANTAQEILMSPSFRVYSSNDVVGVELAGALKNIIALGAGISDGLGYGNNAKSAFISRGLAEITRLGVAAGAKPSTFAGLAGLGDLITTCTSPLSRNNSVGRQLAQGKTLNDILGSMKNVAEGICATSAALKIAEDLKVEMPITQATYRVLFEELDVKHAITELMGRPPKIE